MNYSDLRMIKLSGSLRADDRSELSKLYHLGLSDFLVRNIETMLQGDFKLKGTEYILPNLMHAPSSPGALLYVMAFFLFDLQGEYYTDREGLDAYELRYTLSGSGTLEYKGKKYTIRKGEGFLISNREHHVYYAGANGWKNTVLHFGGELAEHYLREFEASGGPKFSAQELPGFEMLQYQVLSATQNLVAYTDYRVSCLLNLLLTELLSAKSSHAGGNAPHSDYVGEACAWLRDHLSEYVNFDELAARYGVSRSVFYRDFRTHTGFTPGDYLLQLRMNRAKLLLKTTMLSIEEIATAAGYNDAGHFGQVFKRFEGVTPLRYRKR